LLGLGPSWGGEAADEGGILHAWWFWTGVAVLVSGATAAGIWLASSDGGEPAPDRVHFTLEFP
jgi:hypothetical protein